MDNFTEGRIERANAIIDRLREISCKFITGYTCRQSTGEYSYEYKYKMPSCSLEADASDTLSNAVGLIEELIELWEKESEDNKTESRALNILERIQTEHPGYYRNVNTIEITPSGEKLAFWGCSDVEDPKPELLANKKRRTDIVDGFVTLNRLIDDFDSYENVRLERGFGLLDGIYLKYDNKDDGCSFAFQFSEFIKELQNKEDTE